MGRIQVLIVNRIFCMNINLLRFFISDRYRKSSPQKQSSSGNAQRKSNSQREADAVWPVDFLSCCGKKGSPKIRVKHQDWHAAYGLCTRPVKVSA
jgi:hypothetical protein